MIKEAFIGHRTQVEKEINIIRLSQKLESMGNSDLVGSAVSYVKFYDRWVWGLRAGALPAGASGVGLYVGSALQNPELVTISAVGLLATFTYATVGKRIRVGFRQMAEMAIKVTEDRGLNVHKGYIVGVTNQTSNA